MTMQAPTRTVLHPLNTPLPLTLGSCLTPLPRVDDSDDEEESKVPDKYKKWIQAGLSDDDDDSDEDSEEEEEKEEEEPAGVTKEEEKNKEDDAKADGPAI